MWEIEIPQLYSLFTHVRLITNKLHASHIFLEVSKISSNLGMGRQGLDLIELRLYLMNKYWGCAQLVPRNAGGLQKHQSLTNI